MMAGRVARVPARKQALRQVHEHAALAGLVAMAVHGITLLGDRWLNPGPLGVLVPFVIDYRPLAVASGTLRPTSPRRSGSASTSSGGVGAARWPQAPPVHAARLEPGAAARDLRRHRHLHPVDAARPGLDRRPGARAVRRSGRPSASTGRASGGQARRTRWRGGSCGGLGDAAHRARDREPGHLGGGQRAGEVEAWPLSQCIAVRSCACGACSMPSPTTLNPSRRAMVTIASTRA